jgi:hypothetical protein
MVSMESKSTKKRSEKAHSQEAASDDLGLRFDDLEHEIIDLVEVVEEGAAPSGASPAEEGEVAHRSVGDEIEADDLELEEEISQEVEGIKRGESDEEMREADEALGEAEDEFESLLRAEPAEPEAKLEDLSSESDDFKEEETDKDLADLFASDELEVSKLLEDGPAEPGESSQPVKEEGSAPDEEFFEGLFDDLEVEEDGVEAVEASFEGGSAKDEVSRDLLAELGLEPDVPAQAAAPRAPAPVEELPEDLFADLERSGQSAPEVPESAVVPPPVSAPNAEELAALVREQVEAVVTRLVEERLPAIAERILMEEIRKIKAAME